MTTDLIPQTVEKVSLWQLFEQEMSQENLSIPQWLLTGWSLAKGDAQEWIHKKQDKTEKRTKTLEGVILFTQRVQTLYPPTGVLSVDTQKSFALCSASDGIKGKIKPPTRAGWYEGQKVKKFIKEYVTPDLPETNLCAVCPRNQKGIPRQDKCTTHLHIYFLPWDAETKAPLDLIPSYLSVPITSLIAYNTYTYSFLGTKLKSLQGYAKNTQRTGAGVNAVVTQFSVKTETAAIAYAVASYTQGETLSAPMAAQIAEYAQNFRRVLRLAATERKEEGMSDQEFTAPLPPEDNFPF